MKKLRAAGSYKQKLKPYNNLQTPVSYQHRDLQQSLTKQATDWVSQRRKSRGIERTTHWSQVQQSDIIPPVCDSVMCVTYATD